MPESRLSTRVDHITPSATLAVDAKAKALKAAGEPVIGFGAGEPDFATPAHIVEAAVEAARDPKNHKYTPAGGLPDLRSAIADATNRNSGVAVEAANVLVTNGGKQAIFNTFAALLNDGDEVIVPAPYWTTYPESIALAGGVQVTVQTGAEEGFKATVEQLEASRTQRTKALLFVSPSNPSGAVYSRAEIVAIGEWAASHDLWVITDEIYEHLVYGDNQFFSMPGIVPELGDKWVIVNGVAKTFAMTGWRVGWMVGPADIISGAAGLQSHSTSNVANICQRAALAALTGGLDDVAMMRDAFDRRRVTIHSMLNEIEGVTCLEPEGAFYAYPDLRGVLGREVGGITPESSLQLADLILDQAKVAIVPGEAFGTPGYARMSYALGDDDLVEGVTRIAKLLA